MDLPAHVSVSLHVPVVLSIADQLKEQVPVPVHTRTKKTQGMAVYVGVKEMHSTRGQCYLKDNCFFVN